MKPHVFDRLLYRVGPKRILHGVSTAVLPFTSLAERDLIFAKVDAALELIRQHAPIRFAQVLRDIDRIMVSGSPMTRGSYSRELKMCELYIEWIMGSAALPEDVACTIVHEAQHGRLFRLGFGYEGPARNRIERLCYRAQRCFAARLPEGAALREQANQGMVACGDAHTGVAPLETSIQALQALKLPRWTINALVKWMEWRGRHLRRRVP